MKRIWGSIHVVGAKRATPAMCRVLLLALLIGAIGAACADAAASTTRQPSPPGTVPVAAAVATPQVVAPVETAVPRAEPTSDGVISRGPLAAIDRLAVATPTNPASFDATFGPKDDRARGQAAAAIADVPTVEELLEEGQYLAGASPVHLAIRGTPAASSVRCAWRGVARTVNQRADAIRFWLRLGAGGTIPDQVFLERLFAVVLDTVDPDYRETAKANFLAIARGGESMEYLFLTCFADYAVTNFLLGSGTTPTTVTVAYDRRGEAREEGVRGEGGRGGGKREEEE